MKISYGITVHNEAQELKRLLEVLHKNIDDTDEVVVCVDGVVVVGVVGVVGGGGVGGVDVVVVVVSGDDQIYRVIIENVGNRGVKKATYTKLKKYIEKHSVYRTYDYKEARRSQVFLEPIVLPKEFREALVEN